MDWLNLITQWGAPIVGASVFPITVALFKLSKKINAIEENQNKINRIKSRMEAFDENLDKFQRIQQELKLRLNGLPEGMRSMRNEVTTLQTQMTGLTDRAKEIRGDIKDLWKAVNTYHGQPGS